MSNIIEYREVLAKTSQPDVLLEEIRCIFKEAGVVFVALPHMKNSGLNGATKKVNGKVMLLVTDRNHFADTFYFTLMHEVGHIIEGSYGISLNEDSGTEEAYADEFAKETLIPTKPFSTFTDRYSVRSERNLRAFAAQINRDPGIVVGRLLNEGYLDYAFDNTLVRKLCKEFRVERPCV